MSWIQVAFAGRERERGDEDGAPDTTTAILAAHKRKKMDDWTTDERPKDTKSHYDLTGALFILGYKRSGAAKRHRPHFSPGCKAAFEIIS